MADSDRENSLHWKMLGGTDEAYRVAQMIEGLMMAHSKRCSAPAGTRLSGTRH